jgi:hypothetical protein
LKIVFHLLRLSSFHIAVIINPAQTTIIIKAKLHKATISFFIRTVKNPFIVAFDDALFKPAQPGENLLVGIIKLSEQRVHFVQLN